MCLAPEEINESPRGVIDMLTSSRTLSEYITNAWVGNE